MKIPNKHNRLGISNSSGLDFYAPFDNDLNDVVNGLIGTRNDTLGYYSIQQDSTNTMGKYLHAQAPNVGITYNDSSSYMQYGTKDFSISYWLQAPNWTDYSNNCILSKKYNDNDTGFVNYRDSNQTQMTFRVPSADCRTETAIKNVRWVNWIFVRKSGVGYWYRNGVLDRSSSCTGNASSTTILKIGKHDQWYTRAYYNLKALRIYNRALTLKQISDLANEFDVKYYIQASDQTLNFYPYPTNQSQRIQISTPLGVNDFSFSYQIISGTLPSGLTLNTGNGYINGYVNVNEDTNYNLVVRVSSTSNELIPKDVNVTIAAHKETLLTVTSPQTFNFITQASETKAISGSFSSEQPTATVVSGTLPQGISITTASNSCNIVSTGSQNSASSSTVQVAFTADHHQTPVNATFNINIALNQITASNQTVNFYIGNGAITSNPIKYSSQKTITPVYSLNGTLPSGITFDSTNGTFSYDGTNTTAGTATVQVTIASSTGRSVTATAEITLALIEGNSITDIGLDFYAPFDSNFNDTVRGLTAAYGSSFKIVSGNIGKYLQCALNWKTENYSLKWNNSGSLMQYGTGDFSISYWIQAPNWASYDHNTVLAKKSGSNNGFMIARIPANAQKLALVGTDKSVYSSTNVSSSWVNWVLVRQNGVASWYLNGVLDSSDDWTQNITNTNNIRIGYFDSWDKVTAYFNLKALRIYNRAISSGQITALASEFTV